MEALELRAAQLLKRAHLLGPLDAFGQNGNSEPVAESDKRLANRAAARKRIDMRDELAVDLQFCEGHILEVVQVRMAIPEVIDCDSEAELTQLLEELAGKRGI